MPESRILPVSVTRRLSKLLHSAKSKDAFKRTQCVWLHHKFGLRTDQIALVLGWDQRSVRRVFAEVKRDGVAALMPIGRGGRRRENLTWEQEKEIVDHFIEEAMRARVVIVDDIKRAYEEMVGRKVPKSTVYRMLDRHEWRKLMPGLAHPKEDKAAQERFKKNSSARRAYRAESTEETRPSIIADVCGRSEVREDQ
jgi:hypothetical protein